AGRTASARATSCRSGGGPGSRPGCREGRCRAPRGAPPPPRRESSRALRAPRSCAPSRVVEVEDRAVDLGHGLRLLGGEFLAPASRLGLSVPLPGPLLLLRDPLPVVLLDARG